jgi:uncharacterized protein
VFDARGGIHPGFSVDEGAALRLGENEANRGPAVEAVDGELLAVLQLSFTRRPSAGWDLAPVPTLEALGPLLYFLCPPQGGLQVQRMTIYGVSFDMVGKQPIVLLKTVDGNKFLPIWIGHPEAAAILMKLQGASTPRPMTHDLLSDFLDQIDAKCEKVSVTELRDNTFFASITISMNGSEMEIDSRPSDALALAVRCSAPIFAADDVIEESAIEFEHEVEDTEEVVDKFKEFLDNVTPEDFAAGSE